MKLENIHATHQIAKELEEAIRTYERHARNPGYVELTVHGERQPGNVVYHLRDAIQGALRNHIEVLETSLRAYGVEVKGHFAPTSGTSLEQFVAGRTECANLGAVLGDESLMGRPGYLYAGTLYIERMPEGDFLLTLEREDWRSDNLASLEVRLWQWAKDSGHFTD